MKKALAVLLAATLVLGAGAALAEPKYKEHIVYGDNAQIVLLDPHGNVNDNEHHGRLFIMSHDRLSYYNNETKQLEPQLAKSWEFNDTFDKIRVILRDDVKFQNGEPLTAADVEFSLGRKRAGPITQFYDHAEIVNDHELVICLKKPNTDFMALMATTPASIVSKKTCEADPKNGFAVGTGPWIIDVDKYVPADRVELHRNDNYWGEVPKTKFFTFRYIGNASSRLIAVQNDEVDVTYEISFNEMEDAKADPNIEVVPYSGTSTQYLAFNNSSGPATDINLRLAIAHAINRDEIIKVVGDPNGKPTYTQFNWAASGYKPDFATPIGYDPEKAKEYVAKCNGNTKLQIMVNTTSEVYKDEAEVIQEQCRKVGIDIEIWEVDGAGLSANSRYRSPKHQALIYAISYGMYNSDIARTLGVDSNANKGIVNDARITELLGEGVRTLDPEKVKAIYGEIQDIVHDKVYYVPLFYRSKTLVWRKGFKGVTPDPLSRHNFRYAYLEEK